MKEIRQTLHGWWLMAVKIWMHRPQYTSPGIWKSSTPAENKVTSNDYPYFLTRLSNLVLTNSQKHQKIWFDEDQRTQADLLVVLNKLCTQALKPLWGDLSNGDQRVELFLGVFLIVPLARDPDTDTPWHTPDTTAPNVLVELHIDPDVRGAHCLLRKLPDFLDSIGGFLLEGAAGNQDEPKLLITGLKQVAYQHM